MGNKSTKKIRLTQHIKLFVLDLYADSSLRSECHSERSEEPHPQLNSVSS